MKVVATSDTHGNLPEIPECDLFLHAGDICPWDYHHHEFQLEFIRSYFIPWMRAIPATYKLMVWGNHDFIGETHSHLLREYLLCDELTKLPNGITVYGTPWVGEWGSCGELGRPWAYSLNKLDLATKHNNIPKCDIIVAHSPPYGIGDLCSDNGVWKHTGSEELMQSILRNNPKLVVGGHIHHGQCRRRLGDTMIANVSMAGPGERMIHPPQIFEIEASI